jgi:hypothetical protein
MLYKRCIFLLFFCLFSLLGIAQKDRKEIPLKNILGLISNDHQVRFSYIEDEIVVYALTPPDKNWSLEEKNKLPQTHYATAIQAHWRKIFHHL